MSADLPVFGRGSAPAEMRVRLELLKTPGAGPCPLKPCQVITQGGIAGERAHQLTVHEITRPKGPNR